MNKLIFIAGSILATSFLTGCSEEVKSRDWWESHPEEAKKKISECKEKGTDSDNCKNANDGLFRYQQAHAKRPSHMETYNKMKQKQN